MSDAQRINLTFVPYSYVANFVSYMCAKNYLNWFSFHTVIMKLIGVNFFLKHSVVTVLCHTGNQSFSTGSINYR